MQAQTQDPQGIYLMILGAMEKFGKDLCREAVLEKAERVMQAVAHAETETVSVDGQPVTGKRIPLASQKEIHWTMAEDHNDGCTTTLYLLITEDSARYLLRTTHLCRYFKKVVYDNVPGGCAYVPTGEKQEQVYSFTALEDIREEMFCF